MTKRLIVVLALALVAGLVTCSYAEVQNVKVSGDLTVYGISRMFDVAGGNDNKDDNAFASITRVKVESDLTDNVTATVRLLNERYWGTEVEMTGTGTNPNSDLSLDLACVTLKEFMMPAATLTIGRQELRFGNGMIVGDPDTNNAVSTASPFSNLDMDLSARKAFDAIRLTLNYDPLVIDLVSSKITETSLTSSDDVDLYGINANYKLNNDKNNQFKK